ncbi:MAG: class I SAM-dependent methyltransferase [Candidatus Aureabacteria bacterium]|nr:class I SAM-dependent methyltransferase [Candidatus Auribacterota bacterium]
MREITSVATFDHDALKEKGYRYTSGAQLSCRLATQRTLDAILQVERLEGRSVLDVACGDGYFTMQLWDKGHPRSLIGIDAAEHAVALANARKENRSIKFAVADANLLPYRDNSFDLVLLQSMLHHASRPVEIIRESFRLAPRILIHEPNGNNPGVKLVELVSPYHRSHCERSYTSHQLSRWVEEAGGKVTSIIFAGFVPMFCPDWFARFAKRIEPIIEAAPLLRSYCAAVVVLTASRVPETPYSD